MMKWYVFEGLDLKGSYTREGLMSENHWNLPRRQRWEEFNSCIRTNKIYDTP